MSIRIITDLTERRRLAAKHGVSVETLEMLAARDGWEQVLASLDTWGAVIVRPPVEVTTWGTVIVRPPVEVTSPAVKAPSPPHVAERLLYLLLRKEDRKCIPGDLAEEFSTIILPKFGPRYARIWYWRQVGASALPLLEASIRRALTWVGITKLAAAVLRRIGGQ